MNYPQIEIPSDIQSLIDINAPVAVGVSGGKDSVACALAVFRHLRETRHTGPKILVHADLGMVEWADSLPSCERLSRLLISRSGQWDLYVVRRKAGGMMERWESRWESSVRRYENLECVMLILPWSTPSMRFCTSELKNDPITAFLKKEFGKVAVISATGIRADESPNRAKMPASKANPKLHAGGLNWNPILRWSKEDVFAEIEGAGLKLHEAYTVFGSSRVSCAFCIMSRAEDILAGLRDERNLGLYRRMCALELSSAFGFQQTRWLSEAAPTIIAPESVNEAKLRAAKRGVFEAVIPKDLHFKKGWPERMPTESEADAIAYVRREVSALYGFDSKHTTPRAVIGRYAELIEQKNAKCA